MLNNFLSYCSFTQRQPQVNNGKVKSPEEYKHCGSIKTLIGLFKQPNKPHQLLNQ